MDIKASIAVPGILLVLLLTVMMPGCDQPASIESPDYVEPIVDGILQAFNEADYAAYSEHFDDALKEVVSETVFEGTNEFYKDRIGEYESRELTSVEVEGIYTNVTYKAKFSDEPDDVTIGITFWDDEGKIVVSKFWLNSPKLRGQ